MALLTRTALTNLANKVCALARARPLRFAAVALVVPSAVTAIAISAPTAFAPVETEHFAAPTSEIIDLVNASFYQEAVVGRGETYAQTLQRLGVADAALLTFLSQDRGGRQFAASLRPGAIIEAKTHPDGSVLSLTARFSGRDQATELSRHDTKSFTLRTFTLPTVSETVVARGTIQSSLFAATDEQGLPDAIASSLADIFSGQIDFLTDLRKGDQFTVLYEQKLYKGRPLQTGRILAAEFRNKGKALSAIWFQGRSGAGAYFNDQGESLQKGFLRSPLEFSRISSGFSMRRHPILKEWRHHQGTDFAAPTGTRVKASSDGTVDFIGSQGGYGNLIILKHDRGYSTAYGHLNGFAKGLRKGAKVSQGDVIGFVGSTGWATGPHLHYEFRISGKAVDPMKVALPGRPPIHASERAAFLAIAQQRTQALGATAIARNASTPASPTAN